MQPLRASVTSLAFVLFALSGTGFSQAASAPRERVPPPRPAVRTPSPAATAAPAGGSPSTSLSASFPRGLVYDEGTPDGGVWVRGENFKAHFACDGATFVPFFGSSAPRNFEVHLALQSVTVDGAPFELAAAARVERSGNRVTLDRGAVDEVYELGTRSMEQLFVLDVLPAGGEIVLQVGVDTELTRSLTPDGFEFANEFGRVHCGRATAVDAAGRSLELETELVAGGMTIRVPPSFVAGAVGPIVVDPLWFTVDLVTGPAEMLEPDICHPNGAYLCVCWEEVFSATDHDVVCVLVDGNGSYYIGVYVDLTSEHWALPRCGHITASDCVLVAAEVGQPGARSVWGRTIQVANPYAPVMSAKIQISDPADQGEKFNPEVGGDPYPTGPSYFCVVYERALSSNDHDILARLVDGNGFFGGSTIYLENSFSTIDAEPAVSSSNDGSIWNIVWQRNGPAFNRDILAARVAWNGTIWASTFALPATTEDEQRPTVSAAIEGTDRYMVAWGRHTCGTCDIPMFCLVEGTTALSTHPGPGDSGDWDLCPDIATNGRHFVCSYTLRPFLTLAGVVWVSELEPVGDDFVNRETTYMDTQIHANFRSRVVNHEESDPANFSTLSFVVFEDQGDIQMSAYLHFEGGPVEWFCSADPSQGCPCGFSSYDPRGCPNSAHPDGAGLAGTGFASTAHDTLTLEFTDLPANTTALLFQSTSTSHSVLGDGVRCLGSPIKRFPLRNANASGATGYGSAYGDVPISVYGAVPPIGGVFNYQVWYRDSAAFCTPATTNLTHAVKVSWTP